MFKSSYLCPVKKALTFLVLLLFLFNILGYYFIFEIYKLKVKQEMRRSTHHGSTSLAVLKIIDPSSDPDFKRVERKEFRYKGSLYDVIREVKSGPVTIFYCIPDKKEEDLLAAMNRVNKSKFLLSLWQHLITVAWSSPGLAFTDTHPVDIIFPAMSVPLHSALMQNWSPPPERS